MNVAEAAPRDSASSPNAPVPANTSSTDAPSTASASAHGACNSMSNSACRVRSDVGRVTRPGGLIYLSFCNWYSPWGGHEMSPWHFLGPRFAERRYRRRHGREPKHLVGRTLYPVHIGPTLRLVRSLPGVEIIDARPRYYPRWCRPVVRLPWLREVLTWNLLLIMRRTR